MKESFVKKQIVNYLYSKGWSRRLVPKELHDQGAASGSGMTATLSFLENQFDSTRIDWKSGT